MIMMNAAAMSPSTSSEAKSRRHLPESLRALVPPDHSGPGHDVILLVEMRRSLIMGCRSCRESFTVYKPENENGGAR